MVAHLQACPELRDVCRAGPALDATDTDPKPVLLAFCLVLRPAKPQPESARALIKLDSDESIVSGLVCLVGGCVGDGRQRLGGWCPFLACWAPSHGGPKVAATSEAFAALAVRLGERWILDERELHPVPDPGQKRPTSHYNTPFPIIKRWFLIIIAYNIGNVVKNDRSARTNGVPGPRPRPEKAYTPL